MSKAGSGEELGWRGSRKQYGYRTKQTVAQLLLKWLGITAGL